MTKWVSVGAVAIAMVLAIVLNIPLVDDGQLDNKNVAPECLELHRLAYCQEKGADWDTHAEDDAIVRYYDVETGTVRTGHLWEIEGADRRVSNDCEVLGDEQGAKYVECALEGSK